MTTDSNGLPLGQGQLFNLSMLSDQDLDQVVEDLKPGIYLVPARTSRGWFHYLIGKGHAALFLREQIMDLVAIATSPDHAQVLEDNKKIGFLVRIK